MKQEWYEQSEKTNVFWLNLMWIISRLVGRRLSRSLLLIPITLLYFLFDGGGRRASQQFLARAGKGNTSFLMTFKHMYHFATVTLDRFYFLGGQGSGFEVEIKGEDCFNKLTRGALLITSHFGSFEVMRVMARTQKQLSLSILLDKSHNSHFINLLSKVDPSLSAQLIDAGQPGTQLVGQIARNIELGSLVGIMADRVLPGQRSIQVGFLGEDATFPLGPWLFAAILKCPIILCFGTYEGGTKYKLDFEPLDITSFSGRSKEVAANAAHYYASRLAYHVERSPFNWFNFYDFWSGHGE